MATLAEIQTEACDDGIAAITSPVRLLQIIAQLLNTDDMTLDEINTAACESGIAEETSPQRLLVIIAQLLQIGGGGGTVCAPAFGVVDPLGVVTPDCLGQFYTNTSFNSFWQATGLTSADWHQWV